MTSYDDYVIDHRTIREKIVVISHDVVRLFRVTSSTIVTISYDDARWSYDDVHRRMLVYVIVYFIGYSRGLSYVWVILARR